MLSGSYSILKLILELSTSTSIGKDKFEGDFSSGILSTFPIHNFSNMFYLTLMLLVANLGNTKILEMTEILTNGYSSESTK